MGSKSSISICEVDFERIVLEIIAAQLRYNQDVLGHLFKSRDSTEIFEI